MRPDNRSEASSHLWFGFYVDVDTYYWNRSMIGLMCTDGEYVDAFRNDMAIDLDGLSLRWIDMHMQGP